MEELKFEPLLQVKRQIQLNIQRKTQKKQQTYGKTKKNDKLKINLSNNNVNKYYCPDLKTKSILDKEASTVVTEANRTKFKKIPYISFKELLME